MEHEQEDFVEVIDNTRPNDVRNRDSAYSIRDEIEHISLEVEKMEQVFSDLWDRVVDPYKSDHRAQILDTLTKTEFMSFMLNKNTLYTKTVEYLNQLLVEVST